MDSGTYGGSDQPLFLKYKITLSNVSIDNTISSGNYSTYETNISLKFLDCVLSKWCSPIMNSDGTYSTYDGRNFYIDLDNMILYIYVAGCNNIKKPITFTKNADVAESSEIWLTIPNNFYDDTFVYCVNGSTWKPYRSDTRITINNNDYVQFKCVKQYDQDSNNYIHFNTDGAVDLSGNIVSLVYNNTVSEYSFYKLFARTSIKDASNLIIPSVNTSSCRGMFSGCTDLINAPVLASQSLSPYCYTQMFYGCTSLTNAPILLARLSQPSCYGHMFYDCTSLQGIECYLELSEYDKDNSTTDWLYNVPSTDECWFSTPHTGIEYGTSYVPNGWTIYNDLSYTDYVEAQAISVDSLPEYYSEDKMHVCGTDSSENGRGELTEDTLGNMEKSFDENGTHPMNTYNADGSFNQEIWGYKSFCSPVQFRNGIYGEDWSIYTHVYNSYATSTVISRNESQSASIQLHKWSDISEQKYVDSIILSSASPNSFDDEDAAIIEIESSAGNGQNNSSITLTSNDIFLQGETHIVGADMTVNANIIPETTASWLGDTTHPWGCVCTQSLRGTTMQNSVERVGEILVYATTLKPDPQANVSGLGDVNDPWETAYIQTLNVTEGLTCEASGYISDLSVNHISCKSLNTNDSDLIEIRGSLAPTENSLYNLGSFDYKFNEIFTDKINASVLSMSVREIQGTNYPPVILCPTDISGDTEFSPVLYGEIGAFSYYHTINRSYTTQYGTIVYGWIWAHGDFVQKQLHPGDIIMSVPPDNTTDYTVYEAEISENEFDISDRRWLNGYFRLLSLVTLNANTKCAKALLIKVSRDAVEYETMND